jgi:hypothetical protein
MENNSCRIALVLQVDVVSLHLVAVHIVNDCKTVSPASEASSLMLDPQQLVDG